MNQNQLDDLIEILSMNGIKVEDSKIYCYCKEIKPYGSIRYYGIEFEVK